MYTIERFGNITLSPFNNDFTLSPVPARLALASTIGGVFDNDGDGRSKQAFPFPLSYDCVVTEDTYANNRTTLDALRAAVGLRAKLYRRAADDSDVHWCVARLAEMPYTWPYRQRGYFEIGLRFLQLTQWNGDDHAGWRFDDGYDFDAALAFDTNDYSVLMTTAMSQVVTNGGTLPTTDVILTITTADFPLTNIVFSTSGISTEFLGFLPTYIPGSHIQWIGTIPAYSELQIDCGAMSVTLNGENAYNDFSLVSGHLGDDWMTFGPGDNTIILTAVGTLTGAMWTVNFKDAWA